MSDKQILAEYKASYGVKPKQKHYTIGELTPEQLALRKLFKSRGQNYVARQSENIVREQCVMCYLGINHVQEYKRLPRHFIVEEFIAFRCDSAIKKLANETLSVRQEIASLKYRLRYARTYSERVSTSKKINELTKSMQPNIDKQTKILELQEKALGAVMLLELQINGLAKSDC